MNAEQLQMILQAIMELAVLIVSFIVIPYLRKKMDKEDFERLCSLAEIFVKAAEQTFKGSGRGKEKNAAVKGALAAKGYDVESPEVEAAIESAVLELPDSNKKVTA